MSIGASSEAGDEDDIRNEIISIKDDIIVLWFMELSLSLFVFDVIYLYNIVIKIGEKLKVKSFHFSL